MKGVATEQPGGIPSRLFTLVLWLFNQSVCIDTRCEIYLGLRVVAYDQEIFDNYRIEMCRNQADFENWLTSYVTNSGALIMHIHWFVKVSF